MLGGLAAFRAGAFVWMAALLVATRADLGHPAPAVVGVVAALIVTVAFGLAVRTRPDVLLRAPVAGLELAVGAYLLVADGWAYGEFHRQSLGSAWPIAGAMALGITMGPGGGVLAGLVLGLSRWGGTHLDDLGSPGPLSLVSTGVLYALAGGIAGFAMRRLRSAEAAISAARAREEVARTLHDGVLQTLAVVQRRSADSELAALAREQERELRTFLFGVDRAPGDLLSELRAQATRAEARDGLRVEVIAVDDPRRLPRAVVEAVTGAVGEALTNAAKHGEASRATVYVEPDDDVLFVSVKDDGSGFDPATAVEGVGLTRSIRGRMTEVGGRVEVASSPGRGAEIRLRVPTRA